MSLGALLPLAGWEACSHPLVFESAESHRNPPASRLDSPRDVGTPPPSGQTSEIVGDSVQDADE